MSSLKSLLKKYGCLLLYEDEALLVLSKAPQVLVIPDRFNNNLPNLFDLLNSFSHFFVVHRIDKETSGVLLFAKTSEAHSILSQEFENRTIKKIYHAITHNAPPNVADIIKQPLLEHKGKVRIDSHGKESKTIYRVLEQFNGFTFLELQPLTGRLHQIRVHLQSIGCPILCDSLYGQGKVFYLSSIKKNYKGKENERPLISRTALHATSLTICHPLTKKIVTFRSPYPDDFATTLQVLRKYAAQ